MAVILPNAQVRAHVLPHPWPRDARGVPVPPALADADVRGPLPGGIVLEQDGNYTIRLDPTFWPVRAGDKVTDETGRSWTLFDRPLLQQIVGHPTAVDCIVARGTLDPPEVP